MEPITVPSPFTPYRHGIVASAAFALSVASLAANFVWHFPGSAAFPWSAFPFSFAWQFRSLPHSFSFFARHDSVVSAAGAVPTLPNSSAATATTVQPRGPVP